MVTLAKRATTTAVNEALVTMLEYEGDAASMAALALADAGYHAEAAEMAAVAGHAYDQAAAVRGAVL